MQMMSQLTQVQAWGCFLVICKCDVSRLGCLGWSWGGGAKGK